MFSAWETYEKQLRIEKTRLSHQVWSHGGSTLKKKRTLNGHFSRPAETDPYAFFLPRIDFKDALPCNRWVLLPGKKNFLVGDLDQRSEFYNLN